MEKLYACRSSHNYYKTLQRLERNLRNGSFAKYSLQKKQQLWNRLNRYACQIGISIKTSIASACIAAGLCFSGSADAQTFTKRTGAANPLNSFDLGFYSTITFVDVDGDGDMDAFAGSRYGAIHYYKNTGTAASPVFTEQTGAANPMNGVSIAYAAPAFVDIDGDGDMDLFIGYKGDYLGNTNIKYYENTGTATSPVFVERTGSGNPFSGIVNKYHTAPVFEDIDGDGDKDCFMGSGSSNILYYKNTGTAVSPAFTLQSGGANPLDGVSVRLYSRPAIVDLDNDGDFDVFVGDYYGMLYYKNTGTATSPVYTLQSGSSNPFDPYMPDYFGAAPAFADIDNDGDKDLFVANFYGTFYYYETTPAVLPLTLIDFTANKEGNHTLLQWHTAAEYNTSEFEIETSDDGSAFSKITTLAAKGSGANTYTSVDNQYHNNTVFYRLKMIDRDNQYSYSKVISLAGSGARITAYPNPAHDFVTVGVGQSSLLQTKAGIYDAYGHLLHNFIINSYQQKVYVGGLPVGVYVLKFQNGTSVNFVKQ